MKKSIFLFFFLFLETLLFGQTIPATKVVDSAGTPPSWVDGDEEIGTHDNQKVIFFVGLGQSKSRPDAMAAAELNANASAAAAIRLIASKQVARAWEVIGAGDTQVKQQVLKGLEAISAKNINVSGLIKIGGWWRQVVTPKVKNGKFDGWNQPIYEYHMRYAMKYELFTQRREEALIEAAKRAANGQQEVADAREILGELDLGKNPPNRKTTHPKEELDVAQEAMNKLQSLPKKTISEDQVKPKAVAKAQQCNDAPDWFYEPPKDNQFYYFAGVGQGAGLDNARNAAVSDIFSQIVFMVSASISSNTSFEQYVEENEKDARKNSALFKKVRSKGEAVVQDFEIFQQCGGKSKDDMGKILDQIYVLAKIPKSEIVAARQRIEAEKAQKRANPMAVFVFSIYPNNKVEEIDSLKGTLENLYQSMGYNIASADLDFDANILKNAGKIVSFLKQNTKKGFTRALVCVITPSQTREETLAGKMQVTSYLGNMTVREIDLTTEEILSVNTFEGKGVSMRKDASKKEDAFKKLIKALTDKLLEAPNLGGDSGGSDDYF